jgi:hypothetical protein
MLLNKNEKNFYKNAFATRMKVKSRLLYSNRAEKEFYDHTTLKIKRYNEILLKRLIKNFSFKNSIQIFKYNHL